MKLLRLITIAFLMLLLALPVSVVGAPAYDAITPVMEGETHTAANAASDPNENEANATTGWSASGGGVALAAVASPYVGTYALQITSGGAANYIERATTATVDTWYYASVYAKDTTNNTGYLQTWSNWYPVQNMSKLITAAYALYIGTGRSTATPIRLRLYNATAANVSLIDNVSIRQLRTSSLFSGLQTKTVNAYVGANWNVSYWTQAGVVAGLDNATTPLYFVIAYYDKATAKVYLEKCINGVYTNLINTSTAYVVGATVQIRRAGTTYQVFYNGAQIGADQTVDDASMGYLYGAFSTYAGNTYTGLAFTDNSTATPTITQTYTPTPSYTQTPTHTFTPSFTFTPSWTPSLTASFTFTPTFTLTLTPTVTDTPTITNTPTITFTPTGLLQPQVTYGDMSVVAVLAALLLVFLIGGLIWFSVRFFERKR